LRFGTPLPLDRVVNDRADRDIALNAHGDEKRTGPDLVPAERAAVEFDPGLVREGRITARKAGVVEIAFPPPHRHALAVGAAARVALHGADPRPVPVRSARVVERWDGDHERRYRFALAGTEWPRTGSRERVAAPQLRAALRFGRLEIEADLLGADERGVALRVAPAAEAQLRSADAIEFVASGRAFGAEIRLAGWIERRILEGRAIRYQFRVDERLSDDGAAQHARLRSRLTAEPSRPRAAARDGS
jgi:hypothetical protein